MKIQLTNWLHFRDLGQYFCLSTFFFQRDTEACDIEKKTKIILKMWKIV